jgi:hypothetical protein
MRTYILAAVAAAGIGLGATFGASAVPISGNLVGASAPAPELHKVYYYHRHARRHYRRAYRRGYSVAMATTMATTVATTVVISKGQCRLWQSIPQEV